MRTNGFFFGDPFPLKIIAVGLAPDVLGGGDSLKS